MVYGMVNAHSSVYSLEHLDDQTPSGVHTNRPQVIWYKDISAFLDSQNLLEFWPSRLMTIEERINATTRFIIYACLMLFIVAKRLKYIVFGIFLIGILTFVYKKAHEGHVHDERMA
jgi:cbb3-type cytochrome oxidase subunit 3